MLIKKGITKKDRNEIETILFISPVFVNSIGVNINNGKIINSMWQVSGRGITDSSKKD